MSNTVVTLVIRGYDNTGIHLITCEVDGAREARQVLEAYVAKYPDYTFTMKAE